MTRVVDASVALEWVLPEAGSDAARALLDGEEELLAPDWLLLEVAMCCGVAGSRGDRAPNRSGDSWRCWTDC